MATFQSILSLLSEETWKVAKPTTQAQTGLVPLPPGRSTQHQMLSSQILIIPLLQSIYRCLPKGGSQPENPRRRRNLKNCVFLFLSSSSDQHRGERAKDWNQAAAAACKWCTQLVTRNISWNRTRTGGHDEHRKGGQKRRPGEEEKKRGRAQTNQGKKEGKATKESSSHSPRPLLQRILSHHSKRRERKRPGPADVDLHEQPQ